MAVMSKVLFVGIVGCHASDRLDGRGSSRSVVEGSGSSKAVLHSRGSSRSVADTRGSSRSIGNRRGSNDSDNSDGHRRASTEPISPEQNDLMDSDRWSVRSLEDRSLNSTEKLLMECRSVPIQHQRFKMKKKKLTFKRNFKFVVFILL